jgi:flagellar protein FlaG
MEINSQPNVAPAQLQNSQLKPAGGPSAASRQELPSAGAVMPPIEAKAPPKVPEFKPKDLAKAVEDLQKFVERLGRDLNFRLDEQIDKTIITVMDANTQQIVRQIPSEEIISVARQINESLQELRAGLLMDDRA